MWSILYVSRHVNAIDENGLSPVFREIADISRDKNERHGVTGFLACAATWFCQAIEGERSAVEDAMSRIRRDQRHFDLRVIEAAPIARRRFESFSMGLGVKRMNFANRIAFLSREFHNNSVPADREPGRLLDLLMDLRDIAMRELSSAPAH